MNPILLVFALLAQAQSPSPPARPLPSDGGPGRELTPAHDLYFEDLGVPAPEARIAINAYGRCVAERSPDLASETLTRDFTTRAYRAGLQRLSRHNNGCFRRGGRLRSANLLLAGAVAEGLLNRGNEPLKVRLARAAGQPAAAAYSPSDRIAICVVRSLPDQAARLLASDPASDGEGAAVQALRPAVELCAGGPQRLRITDAGLRAILATAAYRSVHGGAPVNVARR